MKTSEIQAGMKGYGLSVFKGTIPETFGIEVISVLKKSRPDRDLIIVKCSGQELEESKIVAGMSGSPVYIDGKLIGALAYAWPQSIEAIAGITPIESILYDYNNPLLEKDITRATLFKEQNNYAAVNSNNNLPKLTTIHTPLMISGINEKILNAYSNFFNENNMLPVEMSGAGIWDIPAKYEPGAAIAVQLISGDWSVSGIGTITAITENGNVLAFGHPMFGWGNVEFPAATAGVHTIMKNSRISWKMGSPVENNGSLVQDRFATIMVNPKHKTNMIPVKLSIDYPTSRFSKTYNLKIVNHKNLTPIFLMMSAANCASATGEIAGAQLTIIQKLKIKFNNNYSLESENIEYNEFGGITDLNIFSPLFRLFDNPYKQIKLDAVEYSATVINDELLYEIADIIPSSASAQAGDTVNLKIRLKHTIKPDTFINIAINISDELDEQSNIQLIAASGSRAPVVLSEPTDFSGVLNNLKQLYKSNDLIIYYRLPTDKYMYRNQVFDGSTNIINSKIFTEPSRLRRIPDYNIISAPQNFIIKGGASVRLNLEKKLN